MYKDIDIKLSIYNSLMFYDLIPNNFKVYDNYIDTLLTQLSDDKNVYHKTNHILRAKKIKSI